ncbi:MAG: NAD(P)-dependent oxidoreductase [Haloferacaceae archaeon]
MSETVLLCGDPQQPSESMYESASFLEEHGVQLERVDWHRDASPGAFRETTMQMESRGPESYDAEVIQNNLDGVEMLVVHKAPVSAATMEAGADLELVAAARGGYENVDVDAAAERGISVLHAPGRNQNAVADYAMSLLQAHVRRIPFFARTTKQGEWNLEFDPEQLPPDFSSITLGIVGFGSIGRAVAERARGFDMGVTAYDPYVDDDRIRETGATPAETLHEVVASTDVISLHVRLSEETRHLLGHEEFEAMHDEAVVVNTARGGLIDEDALVTALDTGSIGGAALDVFQQEPLPEGHPLRSFDDRVTLSPHTAGSTSDAVKNGSRIVAQDIERVLDDRAPAHPVC